MKRFLVSSMLTLAALGGAAFATPTNSSAVIPYSFVANGVELPAGRYNLEIHLTMVRLMSDDGRTNVNLPAVQLRASERHPKTQIVMQRQGGRMVLVGVRDANSGVLRVVGPNY